VKVDEKTGSAVRRYHNGIHCCGPTMPTTDEASQDFASLNPDTVALLLDVDGTLIDIGPSPFEVHVPDTLIATLDRLFVLTGGALALVSGRPIRDLDRLFTPLMLPAIGGHGAETRLRDGATVARTDDLPDDLRRQLIDAAEPGSGVEYEDKGYSVALHYRKAPKHAERLRKQIAAARSAFAAVPTELLLGKAMFEVKRPGINKGAAVRELLREPPFAGRTPVFAGDDVTDESVFRILPEIGGKGFAVHRHFDNVSGIFAAPADFRAALMRLAAP
jgi:trehalose 6-phosphate phosphatase